MPAKANSKVKLANPQLQFLVDALRRNPKAKYADLAARAKAKKLVVWPIMFGRAQVLAGIVKARPRGAGKAAKARREVSAARTAPAATPAPAVARATPPKNADDLFDRLDAVARSFRDAIVAALGSASVSDLASIVAGASAPAASGTTSHRASGSPTPARRAVAPGSVSPLKREIIDVLSASSKALTKHEIARKLRITDQRAKDALTSLRKAKLVRMEGNRRRAVYLAM